jgi:hypothetical protein
MRNPTIISILALALHAAVFAAPPVTLPKAGEAIVAVPVKVTDVWVVIKSHFDLGFTNQAENVFQRYRVEMMDKALGVIDRNRAQPVDKRFVWTVPGWPLAAQMLGPQQDAARKVRIEQAVKDGFLTVHALAGTTHTESLDPETLVRSLGFSSGIARRHGMPLPIAAKMTDVPSHSWIMPTLLEHAGVRFLHLGCNSASQYPRVPPLFWWEGGDGSRVLCGYTIEYGSGLTPPANWPSANYLAMIMAGDNAGPPGPAEMEQWRSQLAQSMPGARVHFGTLDDFAAAVLTEKPDLPVVRGDMPDTWIHGLLANPEATKTARNTQALEPALDALDTHLRLWGLNPPPLANSLAKAYEQSFLYGEHTWGMNAEYGPRTLHGQAWRDWLAAMEQEPVPADGDFTKLPRGGKRKWLQSYQDHRDYANRAAKIVTTGLGATLGLLAANVKAAAGAVIVYNPLPWTRSGMVDFGGKHVYFAENVPPCGYLTLSDKSDKSDPSDWTDQTTLTTPHFTVTFDLTRGGISSLIEKSTGRELADKGSPYVLGQFLHERFSTDEVFTRFFSKYSRIQDGWGLNDIGKPGMADAKQVPYLATTPGAWKASATHSDAADSVTLKSADPKGIAKRYVMIFTFPRHEPFVEVEWQVEGKTADKHPEGGWLCFPFAVEKPLFTVGRPGAPINPATDIVPGTNRHLMAVTSGVALTGPDGSGTAVCPLDSPLVSVGEPGLWRWTMDYVPVKPAVFVNLYNNMWNTNFPLWQEGSWSERVRFWPTAKGTATVTDLTVRSWEARVPLLAVAAAAGGTKLPATQAGLSISRKGVLLTAFGQNPDGPGTVLRVWEQTGVTAEVAITLPGTFISATPVNLRGEKLGEALPVKDRQLTFPLKAYAPASYILQ